MESSTNQKNSRKTLNFYLQNTFSNIFSKDIVDKMQVEKNKIINDLLSKVKQDDFIFSDNLQQFDLATSLYNEHIKLLNDEWSIPIQQSEIKKIKRITKLYSNLFNNLETNQGSFDNLKDKSNKILQENQIYEVAGNLHYLMTHDEIKATISESLKNVRKFTSYEFNQLDSNEWFECKSTNVSRILGANYLKKKFRNENIITLDVPEFIIVIENYNENKPLKIKIHLDSSFPIATSIFDVKIYSRKIIGDPVAIKYTNNSTLKDCGYVDLLGDNGNIIRDHLGIAHVVDTESNSFDIKNVMEHKDFLLFTKYYFWAVNSIDGPKYCVIDVDI